MERRVTFSPRAESQLASIFRYVARAASPSIASSFTESIVSHCLKFSTLSHRGTKRDDILPDLRTIGFRRRVTIAFRVEPEEVVILGVFYGGQSVEARHFR